MLKKPLFILGILGGLLIILGIILNPNLLGTVNPNGQSEWRIIKTHLFRYYLLIIGIIILLFSLIISNQLKEKRKKFYILGIVLIGFSITILSIIFSPTFLVENFSPTRFLNDDGLSKLLSYQIYSLTMGTIIIVVFLIVYFLLNVKRNWLHSIIIIVFGFFVYLILFKFMYIDTKYPSNVLFKPSQYKKVVELFLGQDILLSDFEPNSTLKVKNKKVLKAKFPVIDINLHLSSSFSTAVDKDLLSPENLIKSMDSVGVQIAINSDVENGDLESVLNKYAKKFPDRFMNLWPTGFGLVPMSDEKLSELPDKLENAIKMGAVGEGELWKNLGLKTKDSSGRVIGVDDPRIDPLWSKAGELGIPVLWHMGDPAPMFQPVDRFNERYIELRRYPEWSFYGPNFPSRNTIMKGRENVLKKHPKTIIIGCHMGWNSDDLEYAGYLLDNYPNYYLDLSTTVSELGRQPYTARKFFIKYQDRILFGTDGGSLFGVKGWSVAKFYRAYFEFLETENEYIDYPMQGAINQGSWKVYGINLPDSVLKKIYHENAEKLYKIKLDI